MKKSVVGFVSVVAILSVAACSSSTEDDGDTSEAAVVEAGQCDVVKPGGGAIDRATLDDPFFKLVLDVREPNATCPNTVTPALTRAKKSANKDPKVFVVSENGDKASDRTGYRFVFSQDAQGVASDELFFSLLGSKAGVSQEFMEVMAFSPKKKGYNYYHLVRGRWELAGNGADVKPGQAAAFECAACHTTGGPLMKEQQDSWANWHSTWFSMPAPASSDATLKSFFEKKTRADDLETIIAAGTRRHAKARVDRELAAAGGLKGLLKQVMCEVAEPNIVASHSMNSDRHGNISSFPGTVGSVFLHPMLGHDFRQRNYKDLTKLALGDISIQLDGAAYKTALTTVGMEVQTDGGKAKDAMFPMFTPDRGFADNMIVEELVERRILDKEIVADLLMTDFTVPSYSKVRCDLAETAPTAGANAEAIRTAWIASLARSTKPGAAELKARLENKNDFAAHGTTVQAFLDKCKTRASSDSAKFMEDVVKIVAQRRAEFKEQYESLVESPALLPVASKITVRPHGQRLDPADCTLKAQ